ncbi:MAG: amidohydrolase family protein [Clostridiales bacterium]|nr:amidohydrolase family protein [Clostridiales bacterium]
MVIDFHTHVFPEKVAPRALERLLSGIASQNRKGQAFTDLTVNGLRTSMKESGVDLSVVLPIATKPSQTESINAFAKQIQAQDILSFGSLHPDQDDYERILVDLKQRGFKGIKLHPEFQHFYIDSPRSIQILKKAEELGLLVVVHAGVDVGMPPPVHCTPARLARVLEHVSGERLVAAHLGGFEMWDEVEKHLVGTPIWLDTAVIGPVIDAEQYKRIIKKHGAHKILFATDSPWEDQKEALQTLRSLALSDKEWNLITYQNAARLLEL